MFKYAQIDQFNKVIAISDLSGKVENNSELIFLSEEIDVGLGYVYDKDNKTFTAPEPKIVVPQPSIEEQILAENQYQTMLLEINSLGGV